MSYHAHAAVNVVGRIWMPNVTAAQRIDLTQYDLDNIEEPLTRDTVESWLCTHAGDFRSIDDFTLEHGDHSIPWEDPDNEYVFSDLMYPEED